MKIYILKALLIIEGLLFFNSPLMANIVYKDQMVFKINTKVFSLNDLKTYYEMLDNLQCTYEDSLLQRIFKEEFSKDKKKLFKLGDKLSIEQKSYFAELINFAKLFVYSESQTIVVDPKIKKFFLLSAKQNKCNLDSFVEGGEFTEPMQEIIKMEVFVRSRFLPTEKSGKATAEDIQKALSTARNLMTSIGKQIEDEVYW